MPAPELEARVEALVAVGDLAQAAALALEGGAAARASLLFEQACNYLEAARAAAAAGDLARAVRLAALSGDDALGAELRARLVAELGQDAGRRVALDLSARSHHLQAAALLCDLGDGLAAAQEFERGAAAMSAAECYRAAGRPAEAARVLEAALRGEPRDEADRLRAMLGALYAEHGKHQAAVRVLQQVAPASVFRASILAPLARSLEALGLRQARRDLEPELERQGVDPAAEEPAAAEPASGTTLYGRYRVLSQVASTPHARLLQAEDLLRGHVVALKLFASQSSGTGRDALERFVREARALSQLRHPTVVPLHDYLAEGPAMVLAWMAGGSLRDLMDREPLSPARAMEITRTLLIALGEAHRLGILHRDIKPSNILFDEAGSARLSDFGAAHMADAEATVTAALIGTVAYMSPEQRMGRAASIGSDLYSAGVLLYEMLTGELPEGEIRLGDHHPDLQPAHDALVARFIAERPEDRYRDAMVARAELEALPWSTRIVPRARPKRVSERPPAATSEGRLGPSAHGDRGGFRRLHDRWLERDVLVAVLDDEALALARVFAAADHPAIDPVLRLDSGERELWIAAPLGEPLSHGGGLSPDDVLRVSAALEALHHNGGVHGCIDGDHLYCHAGAVFVAYPTAPAPDASAAGDRRALESLSHVLRL
jgi:serine/threonine-protein kinase